MGLERILTRANGQSVDETWFNLLKKVFIGAFVPRNSSGIPTSLAGSLGTTDYRFKRLHVSSGGLFCGYLKYKYVYSGVSGLLEPGWMLCDGRIINETNYDLEHGAGAWEAHEIVSPVEGRYLPPSDGLHLRGVSMVGDIVSPTQSGVSPITTIGSATFEGEEHDHGDILTSSFANDRNLDRAAPVEDNPVAPKDHQHTLNLTLNSTTFDKNPVSIEMKLFMRIVS
jgi:hypothetical protein